MKVINKRTGKRVEIPDDDGRVLGGVATPEELHNFCKQQLDLFDRLSESRKKQIRNAIDQEILEPPIFGYINNA